VRSVFVFLGKEKSLLFYFWGMKAEEHSAAQQRRNVLSESRRATEIGAAFVAQLDKLDLQILEESNTSSRGSYDDEVTKASGFAYCCGCRCQCC